MKLVLTKQLLLTTAILLTGTACTNENTEGLPGNPSSPSDGDAATRREVVVTIKNKLTVTPAGTKADPIATAEENKISSLDIYVFGSAAEDGDYTFQERFAYRENPTEKPVPAGATSIDLTQTGDGKEASVSMKLQKGLFVKLYAIANQTTLVNPGGALTFTPLVLTNPGQQGTTVKTEGVPTETDFLKFHSPLLVAATTDILATPLPMSGANTVPTDLTDFEAFARIQASFKLTRTVARFDVVNDATTSRFTITDISMGSARKGTTFFPIASVGTAPDDLITLPARTFTGMTNANAGTTPAAFYSYPSPKDDKGYIILTGTYKMNNTETPKTVSYQIPFEQEVNGSGSYIEVAPNHRYTIAITKADDYHLDFNLTVADWTDEGNVDGFEPTEPAPPPIPKTVTINQTLIDAYILLNYDLTEYPPFNCDEGNTSEFGNDHKGKSSDATLAAPYTIEVEDTQGESGDSKNKYLFDYSGAVSYCSAKGGDWRLPTTIEVYAIWAKCKETGKVTESTVFGDKFLVGGDYWCCSVYNATPSERVVMFFDAGAFTNRSTTDEDYVRCVRDI